MVNWRNPAGENKKLLVAEIIRNDLVVEISDMR